jgi:hypothetical protein
LAPTISNKHVTEAKVSYHLRVKKYRGPPELVHHFRL